MRPFKKQFVPKPPMDSPFFPVLLKNFCWIELEIGCGDGEFILEKAKNYPDVYFIGIEKSRSLFRKMQKRYQKVLLDNLSIFHTNAIWWFAHFAHPKSLKKVYILYPNLYVKNRQKNLRWFNRPFMSFLLQCLSYRGELEIRTNSFAYYQECVFKMAEYSYMEKTQDISLNEPAVTAFERKYMRQGHICRALTYSRQS